MAGSFAIPFFLSTGFFISHHHNFSSSRINYRLILLTFALFFAVCVFMCAVAYAFIAVKSSLHTIVKDSDDICSRWMRRIVASDGFIEIGVLGYVFVVAFGVGRGLDLVLGVCW